MRILYLSPYVPFPPYTGGKQRALNILEGIASTHSVTLAAFKDELFKEEHRNHIAALCTDVHLFDPPGRGMEKGWRRRVSKFVHYAMGGSQIQQRFIQDDLFDFLRKEGGAEKWDALLLETIWMYPYCSVLKPKKKVWHFPNLESSSLQRELENARSFSARFTSYFEWRYAKKLEARAGRSKDLCLLVSDEDRKALLAIASDARTDVVPNAIDTTALRPLETKGEEETFLFVGSFQYPPNVDGVVGFFRDVFPLLKKELSNPKWFVVGAHPPARLDPLRSEQGVEVTGFVEDLLPYYRKASAVVVPILVGSGTRIKILEAMALGKPVISTPLGCEGLEVAHKENILIARTPEEFSNALVAVLRDRELARRVGLGGRKLVEEKYSWEKLRDRVGKLIEQ